MESHHRHLHEWFPSFGGAPGASGFGAGREFNNPSFYPMGRPDAPLGGFFPFDSPAGPPPNAPGSSPNWHPSGPPGGGRGRSPWLFGYGNDPSQDPWAFGRGRGGGGPFGSWGGRGGAHPHSYPNFRADMNEEKNKEQEEPDRSRAQTVDSEIVDSESEKGDEDTPTETAEGPKSDDEENNDEENRASPGNPTVPDDQGFPRFVSEQDVREYFARAHYPFAHHHRGGRGHFMRGGAFRGGPPGVSAVMTASVERPTTLIPGPVPDVSNLAHAFSHHPFFHSASPDSNPNPKSKSFTPPVDIFNTPVAFVLHVLLPGAKKEDIDVNWNPESSTLSITGTLRRPGDHDFLQTLTSGESQDDVDGLAMSARMQDGILVITVPKVEREWTQIHKVDIE
ncbi:hypothetical protein PT974_08984 [Cladobotryum mycophilum]|uniref:SHSP domain-containing protein n=1 Tax=Cladobotryum mycophilum TaxID=491253 RepID=A0ABR0SF20_9HYPO